MPSTGLPGQTIDVPLLPQNQQAPDTAAPVGRIKRLVNGMARKFQRDGQGGEVLRVEKRFGFQQLPTTTRGPHSGDSSEPPLSSPSLLTSFNAGEQLLAVDNAQPCVFASGGSQAWERFPYVAPSNRLSQRIVQVSNTQVAIPDMAYVQSRFLYSWTTLDGAAFYTIVGVDGTPLVLPTQLSATRIKVVADQLRFWLFFEAAGVLQVLAISPNGDPIGGATLGSLETGSEWDVTVEGNNVIAAYRLSTGGLGLHIGFLGVVSGVVNLVDTKDASINSGHVYTGSAGLAWLTNDRQDGNGYLVARDINSHYRAYQINGSGVATHTYDITNDGADAAQNVSGFVAPSGAADLTIYMARLNTNHLLHKTDVYLQTFASSSIATLSQTIKSVTPASRSFQMGGRYYNVMFYESGNTVSFSGGRSILGQPTFFLVEMSTGQVCGRWEYGRAAMKWQNNTDPRVTTGSPVALSFDAQWHLSSVVNDAAGVLHAVLGFNAETISELVTDNVPVPATTTVYTVGLKDFALGGPGTPVEYAGELLLPGPMPVAFSGQSFGEQSMSLAPEIAGIPPSTVTGGALTQAVSYTYVVVYEWTNPNGDRARSLTAIPDPTTPLSGSQNAYTLTIYPLHMTAHADVIISVYRNFASGSPPVISSDFRKVSSDLQPLFNDPTADTQTFVDKMSDAAAQLGEPLYTTPGATVTALERDPCPAFSSGCVFQNRVFVAAYDGSIWYSAEKVPGEALWFNADVLRIYMPTSDPIAALAVLDNRLLIFCANSIWFVTGDGWPDGDGQNGRVPMPQQLPFSNGCTGAVRVVRDGAVYASSAGGLWLVSRDINNAQLGAPVVTDLDGRTISAIVDDIDQRLIAAHDQGAECYDTISGVWSAWTTPTNPAFATAWQGRYTFVDAAGGVWQQLLNRVGDGPSLIPIVTTVELAPCNLLGVRNFKRIWQAIMYGQWMGVHGMTVTVTYFDEGAGATSTYPFTPDSSVPYEYDIPLARELVRAVAFTFVDDFPGGVATAGYALESLGFYVAIQKGLNRLPIARRIPPSG